jgi:tripartite-type tricarboxylate transporter receptor subunit TctC
LHACLALFATQTAAQPTYPAERPVRIVVQFAPGGLSDTFARLIGGELAQKLGAPVVVENRAGAGGIIATDHVVKSAPDGYTLLLTIPAPVTSFVALYSKLPYNPSVDLRMISDIAVPWVVLAVHPSVPADDFAGLLKVLQAAPTRYTMGSWGAGTQPHMVQAYMNRTYGLQIQHVAYKGEGPMVVDLLGGVINMTVGTLTSLGPHLESGKLKPIALLGTSRSPAFPNLRTFAEQGYTDSVYSLRGPISLMAPARTPDAIVARLGREVHEIVATPAIRKRIQASGAEPVGNLPAQAAAAYRAYLPVAVKLVRESGVALD